MASLVVSSVIQWIGSALIQEASLVLGIQDQVQDLRGEMELMQLYLRDADTKQRFPEIRALIGNIRKLAYDAEDTIDSYILEVEAKARRTNKLTKLARFIHTTPNMYEVAKNIQFIQASMKRITGKLEAYKVNRLPEFKDRFRRPHDVEYWRRRPRSYPYDDDNDDDDEGRNIVVGLENKIPKLLNVLVGEGKFLFIIGMGGSGKTTLARKLYNHQYINQGYWFDCKAWVCISQEWSTHQALLEILTKVGGSEERAKVHEGSNIVELVNKLREILLSKSYLVVLDDVWTREVLEDILPALPRGSINKGSKIIITTRKKEILQFLQNQITNNLNIHVHEPLPLTEDEGWELFCRIAINHRKLIHDVESFNSLGREMVKKCDGLPLAIEALAGILRTRESIDEWQQVSEAVRSRVMESSWRHMYGKVQDLLALSYDDLPSNLKPCFLYMSVFPEDYHIPVGMLTRMWVAEGFVSAKDDMSLEDVAMELVEELSNRFMIQAVKTNFKGVIKKIRLHDLLHDLCVKKSKEQNFLDVYTQSQNLPNSDLSTPTIQPRRVALHSSTAFPTQASHLRSLVLLNDTTALNVTNVHHNFKLLRLLKLQGINTVDETLPDQIGGLIHLRYLEVRSANITKLPKSIGNLRNLLTLDYRDIADSVSNITIEIPNVLWKLVLLRHLFLPIEYPWATQDLILGTLKNLRTLWGIKTGEGSSWFCRELYKVSATLKKLKVVVSNENDLQAAFNCPSLKSDCLHTLHCELQNGLALDVEPLLCRRLHLYKLVLVGEIRMNLEQLLPTNLVILKLKGSAIHREVNPMEAIGKLHNLKFLSLTNFYKGTKLVCKPNSFPQLEELHLTNLQNLFIWFIMEGSMSCLKKLQIFGCNNLNFPQGLRHITTLQHVEFFIVSPSFYERAIECGWSHTRPKLLHDCEAIIHNAAAIIQHSDTAIQISSLRRLCNDLTAGIFLDNRKKKFWLTKHLDSYYNCFIVYASDLRLRTALPYYIPTVRPTEYYYSNLQDSPYVDCSTVPDSENGAAITVAKLKPSKKPYEVVGIFNTEYLSLQITYEIIWVVKFEEPPEDGSTLPYKMFVDELDFEASISSEFGLPDGSLSIFKTEILAVDRVHEWIQVKVGEFSTSTSQQMIGEAQFSLWYDDDKDRHPLVIKGLIIKPKF